MSLFNVEYPKGVTRDGESTFPIETSHWTEEKRNAAMAFALKEYANNKAGGKDKSADDIIELLTQETFDAWSPATGSGARTPNADVAFINEMRIRIRTHLGVKLADVMDATKGATRATILDYASRVARRRMGAAATDENIQRIVDGHVAKVEAVLALRAEDEEVDLDDAAE